MIILGGGWNPPNLFMCHYVDIIRSGGIWSSLFDGCQVISFDVK